MCGEVKILFPHKKQGISVISLQRSSNVAPKKNEIKEQAIASSVFQKRLYFTKSHHLAQ